MPLLPLVKKEEEVALVNKNEQDLCTVETIISTKTKKNKIK